MSPHHELLWFLKYVQKTDSCWLWQGCLTSKGYGQINHASFRRAHRFSWFLHYGSIPTNLFVCHKCDNPGCVNPVHLFLGTAKQNSQDMVKKGRCNPGRPDNKGSKNGRAKITSKDFIIIKTLLAMNIKQKDIAQKFNVHQETIRRLKFKETW